MPAKICIQCGNEFEQKENSSSKHCSSKCFREKELAYGRRHAATFSHERKRASVLVGCAIASGKLIRQPCEVCGKTSCRGDPIQAHHDDYAAPLDVRWLCRSCHKTHHHKFGPGKNAFLPVAENA